MSGNNRKSINISQDEKKVNSRKIKNIFSAISRRIFNKVYKNEVEYGQTLTKKRRKNCVLKSVSSLPCPSEDNGFFTNSPYHINFRFSKDDLQYRGDVRNFQKINAEDSCCEKCFSNLQKGESLSRISISSDSACDVSSESSCDDEECKYRKSTSKPKPKPKLRLMKKSSKSASEILKTKGSTLENFIRLQNENLECETKNSLYEETTVEENLKNYLSEWTEEPPYETLVEGQRESLEEADYDILVTRANCRVVEPSYENLKLIENFYEMPHCVESHPGIPVIDSIEKMKELMQSNKTYDEVIESLKLWHISSRYTDDCQNCQCCGGKDENEFNHCIEGYESLENDFNNDIEEFCC